MPNALQHETSPYLQQHANNPVAWYPWTAEALDLAREQDKPILLSIGYSACHWCHVMAHESFEDDETAKVMNELFVNIKVDREERPDLDRIYQLSQQLLTGRPGGWPLTVFLTPDGQWPIFAGTYFPKSARYGMPAFTEILKRVAAFYRERRIDVEHTAEQLQDALRRSSEAGEEVPPDGRLRESARRRLGEFHDAAEGGFGTAPKFPHATETGFLLGLSRSDEAAKRMADRSLRAMASGGLFDHLGGGFFRYCVDAEWRIPHFEKMLYDNAMLLGLYSDASALTGDALFTGAANGTADWMLREMRDPDGGFYATLDADSEGQEGRFYVFNRDDLDPMLDDEERVAAMEYFGLGKPANFEGREWHLQPREAAVAFGSADTAIESARRKLLAVRDRRVRPGRDDKILTSWNGLAIGSLARAARCLGRRDLGQAAQRAAGFVRGALWQDGRLKACYKDGRARFPAYLDDYAFLAAGLIDLIQWEFDSTQLRFAIDLADCLLEHFEDPSGGFFFTADDHERLIHRPKPLADESVPSGNGTAALVLDTLGHLLGEPRYLDSAASTVRSASSSVALQPEAHATLLAAMSRQLEPPEIVIVRGARPALPDWRTRLDDIFSPERLLFFIPDDVEDLPGLLGTRKPADATRAYVCRGTECLAPIDDVEALVAHLNGER